MKKYIKVLTGIIFFITIALILFHLQNNREMKVYNSYSSKYGLYQYSTLNVVANRFFILDKESFAEDIVQKCRENTFSNMLFSYDHSIPNELKITVFLSQWHMDQFRPAFTFTYEQISDVKSEKYNIVDHPEQFQISFHSEI